MSPEMKCPKCGSEMVEAADWPDDWVVCLNCLHSEKLEELGEKPVPQKKTKTGTG